MPKITVIGTTTWGTTLAVVLAKKGLQVRLWARTEEEASRATDFSTNPAVEPGVGRPSQLVVTSSLSEAMVGARMLILAVPSQSMRKNIGFGKDLILT